MARSKYRKEIESLIKRLNEATGMKYVTDFAPHYGGWNLYFYGEHHCHCTGAYGFDARKESKDMIRYLNDTLNKIH